MITAFTLKLIIQFIQDIALRNLDYIFTISAPAISNASLEILAKLEKSLDARSSEPWSYRRLPTLTATFPAVIYSEEEGDESGGLVPRYHKKPIFKKNGDTRADLFLQGVSNADEAISKQVRALRKKLQQIEMLEAKKVSGRVLDDQQIAKLQTRSCLETALAQLGFPLETVTKTSLPGLSDSKGNKKVDVSRKERRKSKQKGLAQTEALFKSHESFVELDSHKVLGDDKNLQISEEKDADIKLTAESRIIEESSPFSPHSPRGVSNSHKSMASHSVPSKKKNKKGGLSMFLSGALDDKPVPPPTTPKSEGLAWGGAKITKGPASLHDIQNEQSKIKEAACIKLKERFEDSIEHSGVVRLSSFMCGPPSIPIVVAPSRGLPSSEGEKNTPPWSSTGTSPGQHQPSLRDIQIQQGKKQQSICHSPKTKTSGFSIATSHASPSESGASVPNRWYKPEIDTPSSIRSIQIEEKAMKDLKRFYSSVKLVKVQPQGSWHSSIS